MKYLALLLVAVFAATVTSKAIQKTQNEIAEIDPRILNFLTDFYNQIIVEPVNVYVLNTFLKFKKNLNFFF